MTSRGKEFRTNSLRRIKFSATRPADEALPNVIRDTGGLHAISRRGKKIYKDVEPLQITTHSTELLFCARTDATIFIHLLIFLAIMNSNALPATRLNRLESLVSAEQLTAQPSPPQPVARGHGESSPRSAYSEQTMRTKLTRQISDQWHAEIGALKTQYPDTAAQGLMLYSALFKSLIAQYEHAVLNASGVGVADSIETTSDPISLGMTVDALSHAPQPGNQLSSATQTVMHSAAEQRITRSLVHGLNAMASINHAGTPRALNATVRSITHALAYRLALHRCTKPDADVFESMKKAITTFISTDDRNSTLCNNYAKRITDAIKSPESTISDAKGCIAPADRLEATVTALVAAALTGSEIWSTLLPRARRDVVLTAQALGAAHDDIVKKFALDTPSTADK